MNNINKEDFLKAYNQFPPNKYTKFIFRYFSTAVNKKDNWLSKYITIVLITIFACGLLATIIKLNKKIILISTLSLGCLLCLLCLSAFIAFLMNEYRIYKIRQALGGITTSDYNQLVQKFYDESV